VAVLAWLDTACHEFLEFLPSARTAKYLGQSTISAVLWWAVKFTGMNPKAFAVSAGSSAPHRRV
jgi:hypothetical protein